MGVTSGFHIFNRQTSHEPTISLGVKTEYTPRAVVRLVNIFTGLAYDPKQDVRC
jgi:hypothetical protein